MPRAPQPRKRLSSLEHPRYGSAMSNEPPKGERIAKTLSRAGVASRREAERLIAEGRVAVNGKRIASPALNVTARDRITVDGRAIAEPAPSRLWRYHKPSGLVTSAHDEKGRATVFERLPEKIGRVMPVGRLDITSEGLLLLTNDGELKRRLELPSTGWLRKYRVRVNGAPNEALLERLRRGITANGERFQPMSVVFDRQQGANAWLTMGLREGRNREIRRAMEAIGLVVNRLIRISYGPFALGDLKPGVVEEVRARVLREQIGVSASTGTSSNKASSRRIAHAKRRATAAVKPGGGDHSAALTPRRSKSASTSASSRPQRKHQPGRKP